MNDQPKLQLKTHVKTQVKICGLSNMQSIDAAIDGGASHIGFIFFKKSPRNITVELARELAAPIKGKACRVAVSVNASDEFLDEIVNRMEPDCLQLHGSETPERVRQLKTRYGLATMKALAIRQASDFDLAKDYLAVADRLLFDAKPPAGSDLPGGNGISFDWKLFADWQQDHLGHFIAAANKTGLDNRAKSASLPMLSGPMLSGGINLDNIVEALSLSNAGAVDISSGVEKRPASRTRH